LHLNYPPQPLIIITKVYPLKYTSKLTTSNIMLKNSHKICLHSNNHSEAGTVQGGAPYRVVKRKKCYAEEMCMGGKGRRNPATYICAEQRAFGTNSHRTIWPGERGEIKSLPTNTHRHSPIRTHLYLSYKMCLVNSLPMRDCT